MDASVRSQVVENFSRYVLGGRSRALQGFQEHRLQAFQVAARAGEVIAGKCLRPARRFLQRQFRSFGKLRQRRVQPRDGLFETFPRDVGLCR